jgi:hypothetical protein
VAQPAALSGPRLQGARLPFEPAEEREVDPVRGHCAFTAAGSGFCSDL